MFVLRFVCVEARMDESHCHVKANVLGRKKENEPLGWRCGLEVEFVLTSHSQFPANSTPWHISINGVLSLLVAIILKYFHSVISLQILSMIVASGGDIVCYQHLKILPWWQLPWSDVDISADGQGLWNPRKPLQNCKPESSQSSVCMVLPVHRSSDSRGSESLL